MHFRRILCSLLAAVYLATAAAVPVYTTTSFVAPTTAEAGLASKAAKFMVARMVGKAIKNVAKRKARSYIQKNGASLLRKGGSKATDLLLDYIKKNPKLRRDAIAAAHKFARANPRYKNAADQVVGLLKGGRNRVIALGKQKIPSAADNAAKWVRPKGWRLPNSSKGKWSGAEGNSLWRSADPKVLDVTKGEPIPFVRGYPDFTKWAKGRVHVPRLNGTKADVAKSHSALRNELGLGTNAEVKSWLRANRLQMHHHQDGKSIILVPEGLHGLAHQGGASMLRNVLP